MFGWNYDAWKLESPYDLPPYDVDEYEPEYEPEYEEE